MADKVIQVNVTSTKSQRVSVSPGNVQNEISATPDSSLYYSNLAKNWAIASGLILNEDYSSKHYAKESANSASSAKNYADVAQAIYQNVQQVANTALTDIDTARVDAVDNITTVKSESIASVEAKGNEVVSTVNAGIANIEAKANEASTLVNAGIAEINTTKTNAVNAVTTTKNNAVTEINNKVADGKQELNDIIEAGGLNINDKITNCLLEVPQNIKLELNNGTLTLKKGSKVIVPNGAGVFDEVVITSDMVFKNTALGNREAYIIIRTNPLDIQIPPVLSCSSGTSTPSAGWYYNTTENKIYRGGLFEGASLPIAKVTYVNGSGVISIDETFNDMGCFGSTIFANKDIKGLIPDGRNADGTLNNRELNSPAVRTVNVGKNQTNFSLVLHNEGLYILGPFNYVASGATPLATGVCYVEATNKLYNNGGQRWWVYIASFSTDANGRITSLKTKLPFRAVDYNDALLKSDKSEISGWGMPDYSAGISVDITTSDKSFTAPCDGLYVTMPYTDGVNYLIVNGVATVYGYQDTSSGEHVEGVTIPLGKNDVIKWQKNLYSSKTYYSAFFPLKGAN